MPTKAKPLTYTTKTQASSNYLATLARQLGPGAKLPTMAALSQELGISVMTLNRSLSELEAQGIVVRRQGSGTYVAEQLSQTAVALVYDRDVFGPDASPFCSLLLHEATKLAEANNEQFGLYLMLPEIEGELTGPPIPLDLDEAIRTKRLGGALFAGESNPAALQWLLKQGLPLVALSHAPVAPYRVRIDHGEVAYRGATELARRGCQRIALWIPAGVGIGPDETSADFEELTQFKRALEENKAKYDEKLVFNLSQLSANVPATPLGSNREQGKNAALEVFGGDKSNWPDGIVCLDDMMALGALAEMRKLRVALGEDVQFATHSNVGSSLLIGFGDDLILLQIDPARVAGAMSQMLESLLRGEEIREPVVAVGPSVG